MTGNPLLEAVQDLTQPDKHGYKQDVIEDGEVVGADMQTIKTIPLLDQLDSAIRSSMGGASTSGASLAFEGAVLNTAALFTAMKISSEIRSWCVMAKLTPSINPKKTAADLVQWYRWADGRKMLLETERFHIRKLTGWASQIRSLLDPPREAYLVDDCPECGAHQWWDKNDGKPYPHPLIYRYRLSDADIINDARAMCRACETTWGVRELKFILEQHTV